MDSIVVENISKRYRLGKGPGPFDWAQGLWRELPFVGGQEAEERPVREIWALREVSFTTQPGTILGVIGPNGAGKTTLLKVLGRVTLPTEGRAVVGGRVASLLEPRIGFQPELTGRENIFLRAALHGMPRAEVLKRMDEIIQFAELEAFIDTPLKRFSSGMYLRLAFSVVVNMEPDILLADEVLAVGDLAFQERCLQRVEEAGAAGMTVLFVSHDMAAISRLCHRVLRLNAGSIVELGEPEVVVSHYENAAWTMIAGRAKQGKKGSHVNKYGEILSTHLLSSAGKEIGAARVSEELFLKITFNMLTGGVKVRCAFDVGTRGIHAFRSIQPQDTEVPQPGIYSATARIPAHLLSDTTYTVNASVLIMKDEAELPLAEYSALTFQVYDTDAADLPARPTDKRRLAGVVTPRLDWQVTQEREVVRA